MSIDDLSVRFSTLRFYPFLLEIRSQASLFPFFRRVTFHPASIHEFRPGSFFFHRIPACRVAYPLLRIRILRLALNMTG